MVAPFAAAKAYAAIQAQAAALTGNAGGVTAGASPHDFSEVLRTAMDDAVKTSKNAEQQMVANVQGKADLIDVATAVTSAQASLQTVLAVRDQVIAAYQQVMAMPI